MTTRQTKLDGSTVYPPLPLDKGSQQIRILRLRPGRNADPLQGTLRVVSLRDQPRYEALSYTWGKSTYEPQPAIVVNGSSRLPLTDNLYHALSRLRRSFRSRDLWIDALCINQNDPQERGHQVSFMGSIYHGARRVCVWLGEVDVACFWNRLLLQAVPLSLQTSVACLRILSIYLRPMGRILGLVALERYIYAALSTSLPRWDSRAWTYQEVLNAKDLMWCIGPIERHTDLRSFAEYLGRPDAYPFSGVTDDSIAMRLCEYLYGVIDVTSSATETRGLLQHARCIKWMSTADLRDRVFSIKSVSCREQADLISTDYNKSVVTVFAEATFATIAESRKLNALLYATCLETSDVTDLPTWAIDFSSKETFGGLAIQALERTVEFHFTVSPQAALPRMSECQTRLILPLKIVGTIWHVSSSFVLGNRVAIEDKIAAFRRLSDPDMDSDLEDSIPVSQLTTQANKEESEMTSSAASTDGPSEQADKIDFDTYLRWFRGDVEPPMRCYGMGGPSFDFDTRSGLILVIRYLSFCRDTDSRKFSMFRTPQGYMGLGPRYSAPGDVVAFSDCSRLPLLLRPRGKEFAFVGFTYIDGPGDREAEVIRTLENVVPQEVVLV